MKCQWCGKYINSQSKKCNSCHYPRFVVLPETMALPKPTIISHDTFEWSKPNERYKPPKPPKDFEKW